MDVFSAATSLMTREGRADPYPRYEVLRSAGPVLALGVGYTVVTGYAAAQQALRDPRFEVEDVGYFDAVYPGWRDHSAVATFAHSLLNLNEPDHSRVRRLAARAFTARRVAGLLPKVEQATGELLDRMAELMAGGRPADFMAEFAYLLPVTVICDLLGVPRADRDWFRPRATDLTATLEMTLDTTALGAADRADGELRDYFTALIRDRRRRPADDLVSALACAGELSDVELLANLILLLVAGFETTTSLLGNGLDLLLDRPEHVDRLRRDVGIVEGFVEEVLRYESPVQLTSRRLPGGPAELAGERVEGSVLLLIGAANRDPERFAAPAQFRPDRPDAGSLSFGAGAHYCLGAALARLEGRVAFPALARRFPALVRAGTPERRDRLTLRGYATLPVRLG